MISSSGATKSVSRVSLFTSFGHQILIMAMQMVHGTVLKVQDLTSSLITHMVCSQHKTAKICQIAVGRSSGVMGRGYFGGRGTLCEAKEHDHTNYGTDSAPWKCVQMKHDRWKIA